MNRRPNLDDIEELLSRAQGQFETSFGSNGPILSAKQTNHQLETAVGRLLKGTSETLAAVPALEEIKRWVQVHWDIERETQPPDGTFAIDDEWVSECDAQLDALAAAVKLCLAALGHGTEIVAKCAIDFSRHGMIEVRSVYLFKGASLSRATVLDDHCTLVPYKEALHSVNSDSEWYRLDSIGWPPGDAVDVCALEAKSYEHPLCRHPEMRSTGVEYGRRLSPLLRSGAEVLGLILGLTWGTGHRAFGRCHGVAPAVSASLPFFRAGPRRRGIRQVLLTLPSLRQTPMRRPLNSLEVAELIRGYSVLPDQMRRIADLALRRLREVVCETARRRGKVIIPSFAVGRTQEIVFALNQVDARGDIPEIPVFVDSPLAVNATDVFRMHPESWDTSVQTFLEDGRRRSPFDYPRIEYVREVRRSKQLNHMTEPAIIISASGMAESGRILHHLKNNITHAENTVLFVSFQAQHTLGRRILEGREKVRIFGEEYDVRAEVARINGYSAHADQAELVAWASHFDRERLERVFLVHGEPEGAGALAGKLREQGHGDVVVPELHGSFEF